MQEIGVGERNTFGLPRGPGGVQQRGHLIASTFRFHRRFARGRSQKGIPADQARGRFILQLQHEAKCGTLLR